MKNSLTFVVEPDTGKLTVEVSGAAKDTVHEFVKVLGKGTSINCARPDKLTIRLTSPQTPSATDDFSIWLYDLYHNSVVDGPGRRSVIRVAGCSVRCPGCYVPQTHDRANGYLVSISSIVNEIFENRHTHDGVTILGGEPFDQAASVAELVSRLKKRGLHITVYSGNTLETLIGRKDKSVDYILTHIDLLIDGPFVAQLSQGAGEYRGSRNQRIISRP
ncbi:MAG: radical SAM protein [Acidobacteria bacterium]|nr:radical SAM protein [Acidobacteriota bacterium]